VTLPAWVLEEIARYEAPSTGKVVIEMERYQGGVTKLEIGGVVRVKPPQAERANAS
jgi:hypothetical protein